MADGDVSMRFTLPESALPKRFIEIARDATRRAEAGRLKGSPRADLDTVSTRRGRDRSTTTGGPA